MANEYGEIEQLVNDVTSLDTARMTLRWALEKLNSIEKEKADLKKNLTLAEETAKRLQVKEASLTDAYSSRNKTLEEKEDFYTKLEATMSLLGEGKLDIQQLLKKEAKLDSLRHSLEQEYSDKFEELDRNQRSVIERWNSRLLEVESQYAGRLAEAQKKYDGLRAELEGEHQGRLSRLETSFKAREKDLNERIGGLEKCVHLSEEKVETRRRELEGEYLAKKRETEENYRKLRNMLEAGLEEKIRAADSDHAEQVRSFETSWQIERARLLEEQHVREAQYASAQDRIKDIENALAVQQETHHTELLKIISEKETAFRAQLAALEAEKSAKEATVRELQARLEKKAAAWDADRARLQAEYDARVSVIEEGQRGHASSLEKTYEEKKKEVENDLAAGRAEFEKEFNARLESERKSMDAEKAVLEEEKRAREEALAVNSARLKELESAITATREEHHKDLMERIRSGEASFREKLAGFESEKQAYNQTINKLTDELRQKEASNIEEKRKIVEEFESKASALEAGYSARIASLEADYSARVAAVKAEAVEEIKAVKAGAAEEIKTVKAETAEQINAVRTEAIGKIESVQAESADTIEAVHAEAADKIEAERKNWHAERSRFENMLSEASGNYAEAQKKIETYDAALRQAGMANAGLEERFNRGLIEARANYEKELSVRVKESVAAQTADLFQALEAATARQAELSTELDAKTDVINALNHSVVEAKRDCEARASASVSEAVAARRAELEKIYARKQAAFEEDCQARLEVMNSEFTIKCERLAEENASLRKDIERESADAAKANARAKEQGEKLLAAEKAFHNEKIELQKAQITELEQTVADAVSTAVEMAEDRLRHAQEELEKSKKVNREEVKLLEEGFDAEKDQLLEEIGRRDRYIENADMKVQELERAMIKYRQTASGELMKNISDQDARFREMAAEEKARGDARIKQLESLLSAKEKLLSEGDKFYRQKQLELDNLHAALNMRVNGFNQEIFSQKQELSEKEKELNEYRLKLEKDYALKNSELEQMKAELSRAILEYRKR
ncbi:MAG: hypothetical protein PHV36_04175 [Elusimicrobiales bacterium]|nr:hypothetical protein [Elusimicrobiales bacterium]